MRPKRLVAVLDGDETALGMRCMLLALWGYAVFPAQTGEELAELLEAGPMDVVLAVLPGCEHRALLRLAHELGARVMTLDVKANDPLSIANVSLNAKAPAIEVRRALRILAARKRGPKREDAACEAARMELRERMKVS